MMACNIQQRNAEAYFRAVFGGTSGVEDDDEDADGPERPAALTAEANDRPLVGLKKHAMDDFDSKQNGQLKINGTLWAAYNAAVWAIDYKRPTSRDPVDDLCLADGARLKEKARKEAERLLEARGFPM